MIARLSPIVVSLTSLVGLIVLIALGKLTADVGVPIIAALAGVHIGSGTILAASAPPVAPPGGSPPPGVPAAVTAALVAAQQASRGMTGAE